MATKNIEIEGLNKPGNILKDFEEKLKGPATAIPVSEDDMMSSVTDSVRNAGEAARNATDAMEVLRDILKVDPDEFKEKMVIKALKNACAGYGSGYVGDLYMDALEVLEKAIAERDMARKGVEEQKEIIESLQENCDKICNRITLARLILSRPIIFKYPDIGKRKYSNDEYWNLAAGVKDQLVHREKIIMDALEGAAGLSAEEK